MLHINKLILPGQKETKKLQDLLYKKDKVSLNSYNKDGLILLGISILNKLNIHGGAWELEDELKILDGD